MGFAAAVSFCGFATSAKACGCEAGIEVELNKNETPEKKTKNFF